MPSITVENYVKQLYMEQQRHPGRLVPMGRLARVMHVVPGTATTMIKALADSGLAEYRPRSGVRLTRGGEQLALHVLRRHRLLELFLVKVLGFDWSEVHTEAEDLEHAVSDKVLDRMDALLGYPHEDPHGDPIPTARGRVKQRRMISLSDGAVGESWQVAQITDQDSRFLRFAEHNALLPGRRVTVLERDPSADAILLKTSRGPCTISHAAAAKIRVAAAR